MEEFLEEFFDLSFEKAISEEMLERDYVFPRSKMEDYILQMTSIPYKYYIDYICTHYCGAEIDNASIPQFSNFTDGTTNICKVMRDLGDPGLGYIKLGQALLSDGIDRKIGAYQKYGENHVKCASFHGLTYLIYKSWFLTSLGYIYPDLDEELKQYVISRTLLRNPLFRLVISEAVNNDVNIKKYFGGLSESTQIRRSSSCIHLFNIIAKQCNLEGLHLHRIFFSSDQNEINSYDESPNTETSSSTNSHSNGLQKGSYNYLKSQFRGFSQKENLTDIEINRLFKDCRNGNQDATNQIISLYLRLVAEIARYYSRFGAPLDDLIQEGCLGLLQAIDRFDNTKSSRFEYYAKFWIAQYITTAINSWAYMVRIPLNVISSFQKIQIFKEKYEQQYGHRPASTDIDIDEDMSDKRMDYLNRLPSSLTEITELHEDMDYLENEYSLVDDFEENDYNHYYINKLQDVLSRRDTEIVEAFYGLGDYRGQVNTLEMVGDKFGLTRERCRQVVEKARREMREQAKVVVRDPFRMELTPGINRFVPEPESRVITEKEKNQENSEINESTPENAPEKKKRGRPLKIKNTTDTNEQKNTAVNTAREKERDVTTIVDGKYGIGISSNKGYIYDVATHKKLYESRGKIVYIRQQFYRLYYAYSSIAIHQIRVLPNNSFLTGDLVLYAGMKTQIHGRLNKTNYDKQIQDIKIDARTLDYLIKVNGDWYDSKGSQIKQ